MPSPLAHLAAGALTAQWLNRSQSPPRRRVRLWWVCLAACMAPDLDLIPGVLAGDLPAYHNQASHSILFGLLAAGLAAGPVRRWLGGGLHFGLVYAILAGGYGLHLFMDGLTFGRGLMLFWPFSEVRFASPILLFYGVRHSEGLLSASHLITIATELALMGALYLGLHALRRIRGAGAPAGPT